MTPDPPDYSIGLFTYMGVTDSDWATAPFGTSLWLCAELVPAIPGVDVTFHVPTISGGPDYTAADWTTPTGEGTGYPGPGYPGLARMEWNGATGPNYPTLTYPVTATTADGSESGGLSVTWHHAPDVGVPDYHTPPPVLTYTQTLDDIVTLHWAPDFTVSTIYRRIVWVVERVYLSELSSYPDIDAGPWTDISNTDPALHYKTDGPITEPTYYRVRQLEPIPLIAIYSAILEVTPGGGTGGTGAGTGASWGVIAR